MCPFYQPRRIVFATILSSLHIVNFQERENTSDIINLKLDVLFLSERESDLLVNVLESLVSHVLFQSHGNFLK